MINNPFKFNLNVYVCKEMPSMCFKTSSDYTGYPKFNFIKYKLLLLSTATKKTFRDKFNGKTENLKALGFYGVIT